MQFWLEEFADEYSYDYTQWQREAAQLAVALRAYLPEIDRAADLAELVAVWAEIDGLITSEQGKALRVAYAEAQGRAERAALEEQRQAEWAEAEHRAEAERERKAISTPPATPNGYAAAAAMLVTHLAKRQDERQGKLDRNGACAYPHRSPVAADRLYGVPHRDWSDRMTGHAYAGAPQYRACKQHFSAAEAQLNREGYADTCYWGLPL